MQKKMKSKIILASKSKRRQELLSLIGVKFEVYVSNFDENSIIFNGNINEYVIKLAEGKCNNIINKFPENIILSADTVVYANNEILGKPKDKNEAFEFIRSLSNKTHEVITGLCIYDGEKKKKIKDCCVTKVSVQKLEDEEIWWYVNTDDILEAAGAYRIQKGFSRYIESIKGSYHNVVGLPVNMVYNYLKAITK